MSASSSAGNLTNVNGTLYFTANDGTHGYQLWTSDGITATRLKKAAPTNVIRSMTFSR